MNDRYLYRGKRKNNGKWVQGSLITYNDNSVSIKQRCEDAALGMASIFYVDPATIGQCTGLRDKNEKLIYEGDVVCIINPGSDRISVIEWNGACFTAREIGSTSKFNWYNFCNMDHSPIIPEIIGNIHDNPELLAHEI